MKRYTCMNEVMLVEHPDGPLMKRSEVHALLRAVAEEVGKVKCEDGEQGPCFDDGVVEQCDNCKAKSRALALLEVK